MSIRYELYLPKGALPHIVNDSRSRWRRCLKTGGGQAPCCERARAVSVNHLSTRYLRESDHKKGFKNPRLLISEP